MTNRKIYKYAKSGLFMKQITQSSGQRQYREICEKRSRIVGTEYDLKHDNTLRQNGLHLAFFGIEFETLTPEQEKAIHDLERRRY